MSAQLQSGGAEGRVSGIARSLRNGAAAPVIVLAMLAMVIVPLAPIVLDALFTINIAMSLVVLLADVDV